MPGEHRLEKYWEGGHINSSTKEHNVTLTEGANVSYLHHRLASDSRKVSHYEQTPREYQDDLSNPVPKSPNISRQIKLSSLKVSIENYKHVTMKQN